MVLKLGLSASARGDVPADDTTRNVEVNTAGDELVVDVVKARSRSLLLWDRRVVAMEVLFVGVGVRRFSEAAAWYEQFFGRPPDIVAVPDHEVMWRVADGGWLYVVVDPDRAGKGLVAVAVNGLEATIAELKDRNVSAGPIRPEGDGARKAIVDDPDGNTIALIEVGQASA